MAAAGELPTGTPTERRRSAVLEAPLPSHWRRWQRLKNGFIYGFVRAAFAVLVHLPYRWVELFGLGLGLLAPYIAPTERRRARQHIAQAFPELDSREQRRLVRRVYLHLGRAAAEALHSGRFLDGKHAIRLSSEHRAVVDAAFAEGHGVIAVTGHIGNWELLAQVVARAGYPIAAIAKPTYDPRLTRLIDTQRSRFGMKVIWRGDAGAGKDMLAVLKNGGMLALLIDQDTRVQGDFVPFFGRPAYTPTAAAVLALRFGAPVLMAWEHRCAREHAVHFERLQFERSADPQADVVRLTACMTARLEAAVRECPEQWVWMHRRWHRTPADAARLNT